MTQRIINARLVNEGVEFEADVVIEDGRIAKIDKGISGQPGETVIDAAGKLLIPGMIDDQVHFREPGMTHKGDIASESRAAVAGGITSFMEMPNTAPLTIDAAALEAKIARAAATASANFAFYFGASNDNLEALKRVDPSRTCGIKVFMGASTGNMLVDNPTTLEGIFSSTSLLVATHCEDTPMILALEAEAREQYGDDVPMSEHPRIRSEAACWQSSSMAVGLAKRHGTKLHVLHITTAKELALFEPGPIETKQITAEACVHHLFFDETWYGTKGTAIKCNPAIKRPEDRAAILQAVADDVIDIIATDHAPHTSEEKARSYFGAPAGMPLVQHALPSLFEHHLNGRLSLAQIVHKTAHAPAIRYDVAERGFLREGYCADLTLVDLARVTAVNDQPILSKCGWTPFADIVFRTCIDTTWVNGGIAYENGEVSDTRYSQQLGFNRA